MREEADALGAVKIPRDALYGIQSVRARDNFGFPESPATCHRLLLALVKIKKAAALTHARLIPAKARIYGAVAEAADAFLRGEHRSMFIVPALQGGAGTSANMNVNETLANLALKILGEKPGAYELIHPLDDVNRGQSTNDVYPTALRIAAIELLRELSEEAAKLQEALQIKENEFKDVAKLGRTELMDAVPITLGEEFGAYAQAIARDRWRLYKIEERLRQINLGGTAVGLSPLSAKKYRFGVLERLREITGVGLAASEYPMDVTQNNDVFVEVSGLLKALSVNLAKIANDFRLMNSGPRGGLGEIALAPMQLGSTFMPGKFNPVIPEWVMAVSQKIMGLDLTIGLAASRGEFELNAFLPLIAESLLESLGLSKVAVQYFREKAVETLKANPARCRELLEGSFAFAASFAPTLGHQKVAETLALYPDDPAQALEALKEAAEPPENK
ncbi:MAG: aspartate ammonia-lyase [Deltaproteobacteria bacterium]|jgi:aspartate ammonia-lyase|nr:aspartate ammonia-lyase [Deltaproteobacteria bacterium]